MKSHLKRILSGLFLFFEVNMTLFLKDFCTFGAQKGTKHFNTR